LKVFAACANFVALVTLRDFHDSAAGFTLVCHSEEPFGYAQDKFRDEESAFDFPFPGQKNWEKCKADASLHSA
jgi:hypothetical protein